MVSRSYDLRKYNQECRSLKNHRHFTEPYDLSAAFVIRGGSDIKTRVNIIKFYTAVYENSLYYYCRVCVSLRTC